MDWFYKEFGLLVKNARTSAGLNQEQLGERVGIGRTSITNIECGRQHTPLHVLCRIAAAVGVEPAALLPRARPEPIEGVLSSKLLKKVPEEGKDWVKRVLLSSSVDAANKESESGDGN